MAAKRRCNSGRITKGGTQAAGCGARLLRGRASTHRAGVGVAQSARIGYRPPPRANVDPRLECDVFQQSRQLQTNPLRRYCLPSPVFRLPSPDFHRRQTAQTATPKPSRFHAAMLPSYSTSAGRVPGFTLKNSPSRLPGLAIPNLVQKNGPSRDAVR